MPGPPVINETIAAAKAAAPKQASGGGGVVASVVDATPVPPAMARDADPAQVWRAQHLLTYLTSHLHNSHTRPPTRPQPAADRRAGEAEGRRRADRGRVCREEGGELLRRI